MISIAKKQGISREVELFKLDRGWYMIIQYKIEGDYMSTDKRKLYKTKKQAELQFSYLK